MTRPLLICDCDEVLLHMVRHFGTWLRERHDIAFDAKLPGIAALVGKALARSIGAGLEKIDSLA